MNKTLILIALIVWLLCSLILVCSIIGLLLFLRTDYSTVNWQGDDGMSTWNRIGLGLMKQLIEKH